MKVTVTLYKAGTTLYDGTTIIEQKQMEQMVEAFNNNLQDIHKSGASYYGTIGGKSFPNVNFEYITHKIERVYVEGDSIKADLEILDTPLGKDVMKLLEVDAVKPSLEFIKCGDNSISIHTVSINRK